MRLATTYVNTAEPCFSLWEENVGGRRIQRIVVVRNDDLADFVQDIGPAVAAPNISIPGGQRGSNGKLDIWETVGRLQEFAERERFADYKNKTMMVPNLLEAYGNLVA